MLLLPACDRKENIKSSSDDTLGIIEAFPLLMEMLPEKRMKIN